MNAMRRTLTLAVGLTFALALGGCGGGSKGPDCGANPTAAGCPPTPPPPPPPPIVVTQGTSSLEFEGLLRVPFDAPRAGTLEGEIEWTHATNGILVIVTNGVCTFDQLFAEQCSLISMSLGTAPKPRRFSLAGRAAGPYTMFIGNLGPDDEGVAYQVVLHPSAAAASAANPAHVASPETIDLHRFTRLIELP